MIGALAASLDTLPFTKEEAKKVAAVLCPPPRSGFQGYSVSHLPIRVENRWGGRWRSSLLFELRFRAYLEATVRQPTPFHTGRPDILYSMERVENSGPFGTARVLIIFWVKEPS